MTLNQSEKKRYFVLQLVIEGEMKLVDAAQSMGVSYRQAKRLLKRFSSGGAKDLIHGNRESLSSKRLDETVSKRILKLSKERYYDFNDTHFVEKLQELEGIQVSLETVRRLRRDHGIKPKRRHKPRKHHKRRPRKTHEGMMMLWDGSPHPWFGPDRPPCCLMAAVDDATGKFLAGFFIEAECSYGYLLLLQDVVTVYGIPLCVYQDRHSCLKRNDDNWSLQEQLAGKQDPTQVGMALRALSIATIFAVTPQAKGRIERLFGVLQDRLMAEMRLRGIHTIEAGNRFIREVFRDDFNRRFAQEPQMGPSVWRKVPRDLDLDRALCFHYPSIVGNDNTVRLGGLIIDIPEGSHGRSYAKAIVDVCQLLDGRWKIFYKKKLIARYETTALREPLRTMKRKKPGRAGKESSWVYLSSAPDE